MNSKFSPGQVVSTPNAIQQIGYGDINQGLNRHLQGDWGDLDKHDQKANDEGLKNEGRLFSVYHSSKNIKFWIITEWDRSVTTILMPEDY